MSSFNCTAANASVDVTCTPAASSVSTASNSGSPVAPSGDTNAHPTPAAPLPPSGDTNAHPTPAAPLPPSSDPSLKLSPTTITEGQFDKSVDVVKKWLEKEIRITGASFKNAYLKIAGAIKNEFNLSIEPAFNAIVDLKKNNTKFGDSMSKDYKMESDHIDTLKTDIAALKISAENFKSGTQSILAEATNISQQIINILKLVAETMSLIASNYSNSITENIQLIDSDHPLKQVIYDSLSRIQSRKENTFTSVDQVDWDKVGLSVLVYYAIQRITTLLGGDNKLPNINQPLFNTIFNQPTAPEKKGGGKNSSKKRKRKPKRKTIKRKRPKRKTIKRKHPKHKRLSKKRV